MLNHKLISFVIVILNFTAGNSFSQNITPYGNKNAHLLQYNENKNNPANISVGFGRMFDFRDDSETNLLLSADFALYLNKSFYLKINYDHIFRHNGMFLLSVSPGISFALNKLASIKFSAGLGLANSIFGWLFVETALEFEFKITKRFSSGIEIKYPVGARALPVNFNFILNLY